jgi:hypothetical protein
MKTMDLCLRVTRHALDKRARVVISAHTVPHWLEAVASGGNATIAMRISIKLHFSTHRHGPGSACSSPSAAASLQAAILSAQN